MSKKKIITIGRQFGSGGREIGKRLSEELGLPFYDKELIAIVAKKSGMHEDMVKSMEESVANTFQYSTSMMGAAIWSGIATVYDVPMTDKIFLVQSNVIREIARQGSCVIVGRCADYILQEEEDTMDIFIHAEKAFRMERAIHSYDMPKENAEKNLAKIDKKRASYYNYYTSKKWGMAENYDLTVDSGALGIEKTVELIKAYTALR